MSRLDELLELRRQIDAEIEREHAAAARARELRKDALIAMTRGAWNTRVFQAVCLHFGVSGDDVLGSGRDHRVTRARHVAMWLMREAGRSFPEIGEELGRDHATVMSACRRVDNDPKLSAAAADIYLALTGETMGDVA